MNSFSQLSTSSGQAVLRAAQFIQPRAKDFLIHFQNLARQFPPELAKAALEIAILRLEAVPKFPAADRMYFTRQALEQASSYEISVYRASRYTGFHRVLDMGCSIGSDTFALGDVAETIGVDLDSLRLAMAYANARALGLEDRVSFLQADLRMPLPLARNLPGFGLFFDPARRSQDRRVFSVHDYAPPLDVIHSWLRHYPSLGVKVSPGVDLEELSGVDAEVEFISLKHELKEAVLWFGTHKTASRRATVLPGPHTLISSGVQQLPLGEPGAFLYEPDPAILRAGLVAELGEMLGAVQLDPHIAYLTTELLIPTPYARIWSVADWFPFGLKRLRAYLRERHIGQLVVKKRGSPLEPRQLIHDLHLSGEGEALIVLTHLNGKPIVIYSESVNPLHS